MRAFFKDEKTGRSCLVYASKEAWLDCKCGLNHKHKTPFEAFKCRMENVHLFSDFEKLEEV